MQYYTLGSTGLRVSRLALGTMTFGEDWGWGSSATDSGEIFRRYIEAGGNFFDTANLYTEGNSERLLGKFIKDSGVRDKAVIASKFSFSTDPDNPNAGGNGRKNIRQAVEASLKRLDTDYIDLYIMHTWDQITPPEEVMRTMDDLVREGKILHVGLSDVPAWYAARAQSYAEYENLEPVSSIQLEYSLLERNLEHEFVPMSLSLGMGITCWSPLGSGLLTGKYSKADMDQDGDGRLHQMKDSQNPAFQKFSGRNFSIVDEVRAVAEKLDRSMAQVALNWALNQPAISAVLVGASKIHQLEDNLKALDFDIPKEMMQRLNEVSAPNQPFPYFFFDGVVQNMVHGNADVGSNHPNFHKETSITAPPPSEQD